MNRLTRAWRKTIKLYFGIGRGVYLAASWLYRTFDLLDVTVCASFLLITSGVYMLWGKGWSCITLGVLLLALVVIGIPMRKEA